MPLTGQAGGATRKLATPHPGPGEVNLANGSPLPCQSLGGHNARRAARPMALWPPYPTVGQLRDATSKSHLEERGDNSRGLLWTSPESTMSLLGSQTCLPAYSHRIEPDILGLVFKVPCHSVPTQAA